MPSCTRLAARTTAGALADAKIREEDAHPCVAPITTLSLAQLRVDDYLTRKASGAWPAALVVVRVDADEKRYVLQRPGHQDIELGTEFGNARRALYAAIQHTKAGGRLPD